MCSCRCCCTADSEGPDAQIGPLAVRRFVLVHGFEVDEEGEETEKEVEVRIDTENPE